MSKKTSLIASNEFKVGNHSIGWLDNDFTSRYGSEEFVKRDMPKFQKLPRSMNDATIESELKPGLCELGDVMAFLDNAPEECKDGYSNIFYVGSFVVSVRWGSWYGFWRVSAWHRDGYVWNEGFRVFSPANRSELSAPQTSPSDTLTLDGAIKMVKEAGFKVIREM